MANETSEFGFTLNETLVAVNVGFLLVSFCLMMILLFSKQMTQWQERAELKEAVNGLVQQVAFDAQGSNAITFLADTLLVFERPGDELVSYRLSKSGVYRNNQRYGGPEVDLQTNASVQTRQDRQILYVAVEGAIRQHRYSSEIIVGTLSSSRTRFMTQLVR